ncbi:hypothetical protein Tco_1029182 [Tanacetum coccineum]|uniref:Uncharacterized protein n=1 Tax=Tanacetum coccineum TaxID=301880 RepID=A0ABQ5G326_9ASTR
MMRISKIKMTMFLLLSLCLISDIHASYNGGDFFVLDKAKGEIRYKEARPRYPGRYAPPHDAYNNPSPSFVRHVRGGGGGIGAIGGGKPVDPCGNSGHDIREWFISSDFSEGRDQSSSELDWKSKVFVEVVVPDIGQQTKYKDGKAISQKQLYNLPG